MAKLNRSEFVKGYVQTALEQGLPALKVSKQLAKEVLKGDADSLEIRVTNDFAVAVLEAVETAYQTALVETQSDIGFGKIGTIKVVTKKEGTFRNPSDENAEPIVKPARLGAKLKVSDSFKETLEAIEIN